MKTRSQIIFILSVLCMIASYVHGAGTTRWSGATDQNWSTAGNWTALGGSTPPASGDTALFGTNGTSLTQGTVNNIVDTSRTVAALTYTNISPFFHTTQISPGNTLTVSGGVTMGFSGLALATVVNMTGTGNFTAGASGITHNIGNGTSEPVTWTMGDGINTMTGATFNLGVSGSANGSASVINLGAGTTTLNMDSMNVGTGKSSGTIQFAGANGSIKIRNAAGTGRATIFMGSGTSGSGACNGKLLFAGHSVDVLAGTVTLGAGGGSTGAQVGQVAFDNGTFDATSILMGAQASSSVASSTGILTVGGSANAASLIVNSAGSGSFILSDATSSKPSIGTLTIKDNGTATVSCSITKATAANNTGNINITNGALIMSSSANVIGTPAIPIDNITLTNATLQFSIAAGVTNVAVTTLNLLTTNTVNIASLSAIAGYPSQFPLIKYGTLPGGFNLTLGTLPGTYTGYISNDATATIWLVITNGPTPAKSVFWQGNNSTAWNTSTPNWTNSTGTAVSYNDGDFATFDDSAATFVVNIAATLSPGVLTNNSSASYTFSGSGKISGSAALIKSGTGTLTLTESGGDNFSGGISVNGGTVIIDNDSSTIAGGTTIGASGTVQVGNNDANGVLPSGAVTMNGALNLTQTNSYTVANLIGGAGTLTINPGNTNAVVTISGANTFSGPATVLSGTLKIGNTFAMGVSNGNTTISSGATIDVNGNKVEDHVFVSGWGVASNGCIINSGASQQNALTNITLLGDVAFGGPGDFAASGNPGRWDLRANPAPILSTGGNPYNVYKVGKNQATLVSAVVDSALGDIDIQQGELGVETGTTGLGDPNHNCIIRAGGTMELFNTFISLTSFALNKQFIFYGNGVDTNVMVNSGGIYGTWSNVFIGPVILTNGDVVVAGGSGNPSGVLFSNIISGPGGFIVGGTRASFTNYFTTNNTYTGGTTIKIGTLALIGNGSIANNTSIAINGGAIFDVTGVSSSPYNIYGGTLKSLNAGGAGNIVGAVILNSGALMTLNYTNGSPSLNISSGALTLNDNGVTVTVAGTALPEGSYKVISKGTGGSVAGSVAGANLFVNGAGAVHSSKLSIVGGELFLNVGHAPTIAAIVTNSVNSGSTWKIAISDLSSAAGWSDADGDTITLSSVGPTSANSVSVTKDSNYVYYNAPVTAEDSFSYTIGDGTLTANGTVYVEAVTSTNQTYNISSTVVNGGGSITLSGAGIPNRTNVIERATTLSPPIPWTAVGTNVIDGTGHWQFTDPSPTDPAFYRSMTQP